MNAFEQFGLKEVANVQVYALEDDARLGVSADDIVLYFETLKISNIELTADQTEARGGQGNPPLIVWDFGREVNMTLQDALFTHESLMLMTGGAKKVSSSGNKVTINRTELVRKMEDLPAVDSYKWLDVTTGQRGSTPPVYTLT